MRKAAGWALAVLGTAGLGWWAQGHQAHEIEDQISQAAKSVASGAVHQVETRISGRDIIVEGTADTEAEFDQLVGAMNAIEGRRIVRAEMEILPHLDPYDLEMTKPLGEAIRISGPAPTAADAAAMAALAPASEITLAHGAPEGWSQAAGAGAGALSSLIEGDLALSGKTLTLRGRAQDGEALRTVESALSALPEGYAVDQQIELIDDGHPADYTLSYNATDGATFTGRLNDQLAGADLGARLSVYAIDDQSQADVAAPEIAVQDADETLAVIEAIAPHMPEIESFDLVTKGALPDGAGITADLDLATRPGADAAQIGSDITDALPEALRDRIAITSQTTTALQSDTTERTHQITGEQEYLIDGQWVGAAAPYVLSATKAENGLQLTEGLIPNATARVEIASALGAQADQLTPAFGAPEGWSAASVAGLNALDALGTGDLTITDTDVTLIGTAATPAEAEAARSALSALPQGYTLTEEITVLDDGEPANYSVSYDADAGARIDGRLPQGLSADDLGAAMGVAQMTDASTADTTPGAEDEVAYGKRIMGALAPWLPQAETMQIDVTGGEAPAAKANLALAPGSDLELLSESITGSLPEDLGLDLSITDAAPIEAEDGKTRTNAVTGQTERLSSGFWLPVRDFDTSLEGCTSESAGVLQEFQIGFVSGSDRLNGTAARSVNALASVMGPCIDAGFQAEVGGHTDSTGSAELNQSLSQARAEAVRAALIARGVPEDGLTAKGYGPTQPIASNETEEGKAANRRTEITWTEVGASTTETGN